MIPDHNLMKRLTCLVYQLVTANTCNNGYTYTMMQIHVYINVTKTEKGSYLFSKGAKLGHPPHTHSRWNTVHVTAPAIFPWRFPWRPTRFCTKTLPWTPYLHQVTTSLPVPLSTCVSHLYIKHITTKVPRRGFVLLIEWQPGSCLTESCDITCRKHSIKSTTLYYNVWIKQQW